VTFRHDDLCSAFARAAREVNIHGRVDANLAANYPVANLDPLRKPSSPVVFYPGDLVIINYLGTGQTRFFDITVVDALAATHFHVMEDDVNDTNRNAHLERALRARHDLKMNKYTYSCRLHNVPFAPIVLTHLGRLHKTSDVYISAILGIDKPVPGEPLSSEQLRRKLIKRNLLTEIACIAAKYNAQSLLNHAPPPARPINTP
jgi:hypothetical protein